MPLRYGGVLGFLGCLMIATAGCGGGSSAVGSDAAGGSGGSGGGSVGGDGSADVADVAGTGGASGSGGAPGTGGSVHDDSGTAGDVGRDGAADKPTDQCANSTACAGGTCWQSLNGATMCVGPVQNIPHQTCPSGGGVCCMTDGDCTLGAGGRCVSRQTNLGCGGAVPVGNECHYDGCTKDSDCGQPPAGATVVTCVPAGALGFFTAACVLGGCRTDADCTQHANGRCLFGLAATHNGMCDLRQVLFCAYPSDPCQGVSVGCTQNLICVPNEDYQGQHCGPRPPQYP